jgi:tetratricopeptide (TPR) repeat protein
MKNETGMTSQLFLDQIEKLNDPELNKSKVRSLIEKAITESGCLTDIYWISEVIKNYLNDLDWIRNLLESEESKINPENNDVATDYVILGDTIAENLCDREWVLKCYKQAEKHIQSLWDYYSIIYSLFENLPGNERTLTLLEKAYQFIKKEDPCSSEISAMASLTLEITGSRKKAIGLYQKALDTDENSGICWGDRLAICQSIAMDLEDHKWAKMIIQQPKLDIDCPKAGLTGYQALTLQNYLAQSLDSGIKVVPSIKELRNNYDEIIYCVEVCVIGVVSDINLSDDEGHLNGSLILNDASGSVEVFAVSLAFKGLKETPKIKDILSVKGTLAVQRQLVVFNAKSIQMVD